MSTTATRAKLRQKHAPSKLREAEQQAWLLVREGKVSGWDALAFLVDNLPQLKAAA